MVRTDRSDLCNIESFQIDSNLPSLVCTRGVLQGFFFYQTPAETLSASCACSMCPRVVVVETRSGKDRFSGSDRRLSVFFFFPKKRRLRHFSDRKLFSGSFEPAARIQYTIIIIIIRLRCARRRYNTNLTS